MTEVNVKTTPQLRTRIRSLFGLERRTNIPVIVVSGYGLTLKGKKGGHYTKGGTPVSHPSAYAKRGWSNLIYQKSTLCIEVGEKTLDKLGA